MTSQNDNASKQQSEPKVEKEFNLGLWMGVGMCAFIGIPMLIMMAMKYWA